VINRKARGSDPAPLKIPCQPEPSPLAVILSEAKDPLRFGGFLVASLLGMTACAIPSPSLSRVIPSEARDLVPLGQNRLLLRTGSARDLGPGREGARFLVAALLGMTGGKRSE